MAEIRIGDVTIEPERIRVRRAGADVHLTPTEFRLLVCLALNQGTVVLRKPLYQAAADLVGEPREREVEDNLKVFVRRLRMKLGYDLIRTVPYWGYVIDAEEADLAVSGD